MDDDHTPTDKPDTGTLALCLLGTLGWLLFFFTMGVVVGTRS